MTFDDFLSVIEEGLRVNDGFWNEAEAGRVAPVRDVTQDYIREQEDYGDKR